MSIDSIGTWQALREQARAAGVHAPDPDDDCGAFYRCIACRAPIDHRDGKWVTILGGRGECAGKPLN